MASLLLAQRTLLLEHPQNWLKGQALLSVFISLCMVIVFALGASKAIGSISGPILISPVSESYAILPVDSRAVGSLYRAKANNKNDAGIKSVLAQNVVASSQTAKHFITSFLPFFNRGSSFHNVLRSNFRQICNLLDIPPPSVMVSSEIRGCSILPQI